MREVSTKLTEGEKYLPCLKGIHTMNYTFKTIVCGAYQENCYMLLPENSRDCILIDPGDDLELLKKSISDEGRVLKAILLTHGHFDHILAAQPLSKITGAAVYVHELDNEMLSSGYLNGYNPACSVQPLPRDFEGDILEETFDLSGIHFDVLHTPGHTPGSVCYYDAENNLLFSGDTLFCAGFGRMDLPGGSPAQMRTSLRKLFELPANTAVHCGHGASTTIGTEKGRYRI